MHRFLHGWIAVLALGLSFAPTAHAQDSTGGGSGVLASPGRVGVGLGGSTLSNGITGKLYITEALAAQATVGWWLGAGFSVSADVIVERALYKVPELSVQGYLGAGPSIGFFSVVNNATVIGVSGVGGVGLHVAEVPIEVALELRPTVLVGNQFWNGFYFGGGGAIRWYF